MALSYDRQNCIVTIQFCLTPRIAICTVHARMLFRFMFAFITPKLIGCCEVNLWAHSCIELDLGLGESFISHRSQFIVSYVALLCMTWCFANPMTNLRLASAPGPGSHSSDWATGSCRMSPSISSRPRCCAIWRMHVLRCHYTCSIVAARLCSKTRTPCTSCQ